MGSKKLRLKRAYRSPEKHGQFPPGVIAPAVSRAFNQNSRVVAPFTRLAPRRIFLHRNCDGPIKVNLGPETAWMLPKFADSRILLQTFAPLYR